MLKYMSVGVDFNRNLFYTEGIIRGGSMLKSFHDTLHKMQREILILFICALIAIIGILDYIISFDVSISLFYLAPILLGCGILTGHLVSFYQLRVQSSGLSPV